MQNRELTRQLQKLRQLIKKVVSACGEDLELHAQWGCYMCVLVAGFLENAIAEIYTDFAKSAASEHVARFAEATLARIQNPKADRFVKIAAAFKPAWGDDLQKFLEDNGRKDAIDSIMNNRHLIVHGQDSTITLARVNNYLDKCVEVIEFIETQCKGG
jgi:hypothetical protein